MGLLEQYRAFARYNTWMNRRLYAQAASLSDEERTRDSGAFFKSIHGTLNHLLLTDRVWMARFTGDTERFASRDRDGKLIPVTSLSQELYSDFKELEQERRRTDADIEAFCASLQNRQLGAPMRYMTSSGQTHEHAMWWALSHFFNHQTHHRGQLTSLLKQAGKDLGTTDLIAFLREEG